MEASERDDPRQPNEIRAFCYLPDIDFLVMRAT